MEIVAVFVCLFLVHFNVHYLEHIFLWAKAGYAGKILQTKPWRKPSAPAELISKPGTFYTID